MWKVKNTLIDLPEHFRLIEEEDFIHLFLDETEIATFSYAVDPEIIKTVAETFIKGKEGE